MDAGTPPSPWILIVEDDLEIAELIALYLTQVQLEARIAPSAEAALELLAKDLPALVLLDLHLPGADGFHLLKTLRSWSSLPVMIVSSRDSDEDKLAGLGLGADDFVTKPFSPRVLAAKVQALLRRAQPPTLRRLTFGGFQLDFDALQLTREGLPVELRRREWELLCFLAQSPRKPFSPEQIYEQVWGQSYGDLTTVAVHVQRLRKKLGEPAGEPRYLRTILGFGYAFYPEGEGP